MNKIKSIILMGINMEGIEKERAERQANIMTEMIKEKLLEEINKLEETLKEEEGDEMSDYYMGELETIEEIKEIINKL